MSIVPSKQVPKECSLTITSALTSPNGFDISGFLDKFVDVPYFKVKMSAFSCAFSNTGGADYISITARLNAFDPTAYGSERNILYRASVYATATSGGSINDLGAETKYMIVNRLDLYSLLRVFFETSTVGGFGAITIQNLYAKLSIEPYEE